MAMGIHRCSWNSQTLLVRGRYQYKPRASTSIIRWSGDLPFALKGVNQGKREWNIR